MRKEITTVPFPLPMRLRTFALGAAFSAAFLMATPAQAFAPLREVIATICNTLNPGQDFQYVSDSLSSPGIWDGITDTIPAGSSQNCGGFAALTVVPFFGVKGSVTYEIENWTGSGSNQITFGFDNPWSGSNSYPVSAPDGLLVGILGGSGDIAQVIYWVQYSDSSLAPVPEPSAGGLLGAALLGFIVVRRRSPG